jgi:hypothetical protein
MATLVVSDSEETTIDVDSEDEEDEIIAPQFGRVVEYIVNNPQYEGIPAVNLMRQEYLNDPNSYTITQTLNKITIHVQMVLAGAATPEQFNIDFETVRNDREVRSLMWLIVSGEVDINNPLNAFVGTAYENRTQDTDNTRYIDPFWPFVANDADLPVNNDEERKEFLIDEVWTAVNYVAPQGKEQGRAGWYYGITDARATVKVRGKRRVRDITNNTRATVQTFLQEVQNRRRVYSRIKQEKEKFYSLFFDNAYTTALNVVKKKIGLKASEAEKLKTVFSYRITETHEHRGISYKRGQKIDISEVEKENIQLRYVARLAVVIREMEQMPVYKENQGPNRSNSSKTLKIGNQYYESLQREFRDDPQENNNNNNKKKAYIKLYKPTKIQEGKIGALEYYLVSTRNAKRYISPIPEVGWGDSLGACLNYKGDKIVGRIPASSYLWYVGNFVVPVVSFAGFTMKALITDWKVLSVGSILDYMFPLCEKFDQSFTRQIAVKASGFYNICTTTGGLKRQEYWYALGTLVPVVAAKMGTFIPTTNVTYSVLKSLANLQLQFITKKIGIPFGNVSILDIPLDRIKRLKQYFVDQILWLINQKGMKTDALSRLLSNVINIVLGVFVAGIGSAFNLTKPKIIQVVEQWFGGITYQGIRNMATIMAALNFFVLIVQNTCFFMFKMTKQLENCKYQPQQTKSSKKRPAQLHREMLDSLVQLKF